MTHLGFASGHGIRTIDRKPEGMSWRSTENRRELAITKRSLRGLLLFLGALSWLGLGPLRFYV